jgi:hypothetical protein
VGLTFTATGLGKADVPIIDTAVSGTSFVRAFLKTLQP